MIRQVLKGGRAVELESEMADPGAKPGRKPVPWLDPPPGPWPVERAYAYCEEFVRAHHEGAATLVALATSSGIGILILATRFLVA